MIITSMVVVFCFILGFCPRFGKSISVGKSGLIAKVYLKITVAYGIHVCQLIEQTKIEVLSVLKCYLHLTHS